MKLRWSKLPVFVFVLGAGCGGTDKYPERIVGNWRPVSSNAGGGQMRLDEDGTIEEVAPGGAVRKGTYRFVKRDVIEVSFPELVQRSGGKERMRSRWPARKEQRRIVSLSADEMVLAGDEWKMKYARAKRFP